MLKLIFGLVCCVGILLAAGLLVQVHGDQTRISSYRPAQKLFWERIYAKGGETLYCGVRFGSKKQLGSSGTIEHVLPRDDLEALCSPRNRQCERYAHAVADLHNMWPELREPNSWRSNYPYQEIPGEDHRILTDDCPDLERKKTPVGYVVEPRDEVKGNIARSILYMQREYRLQVREDTSMLLRWHRSDPPDQLERWRNDVIERLQGTRNPYIDENPDRH
jgi:deoxyribonuclease-1